MENIHVAIQLTHRLECLNLFLDIVKSNFKSNFVTHVFCNLGEESFLRYKEKIDFKLIDHFHHFPDDTQMRQNVYETINVKQKFKSEQPLRLLKNVLSTMSSKDVDKFIYTECDVFPLEEDSYIRFYRDLKEDDMFAFYNTNGLVSPKNPDGFILPGPVYFSKKAAKLVSDAILEPIRPSAISFEGRFMSAVRTTKLPIKVYQLNEFPQNNIISDNNRCPITETSHQHNILNLDKTFRSMNITNGTWVNQVLANERLYEEASGEDLVKDHNFKLKYWNGLTDYQKYWNKPPVVLQSNTERPISLPIRIPIQLIERR